MTRVEARLVRGKLYRSAKMEGDDPIDPPFRSDEIVVACGKTDKNRNQTCRGTFGTIDTFHAPEHAKFALWGIFRYENVRGVFRATNRGQKESNRGEMPRLRRSVVQMPYLTRDGAADRRKFGLRPQDYRDYGVMGDRITGNAVNLPVEVECPRCGTRQTVPARLREEAWAIAHG